MDPGILPNSDAFTVAVILTSAFLGALWRGTILLGSHHKEVVDLWKQRTERAETSALEWREIAMGSVPQTGRAVTAMERALGEQ